MMKKILLLSLILGISIGYTFSQAKKYLFMEHFTNSKCSICGASNPGYYTNLANFKGEYHHIAIHPSFPYNTCPLYLGNTVENTARTNYYNISSTPTVVINGTTKKSASQMTTSVISAEIGKTSPIQVKVSENTGTSRSVNIEVKSIGSAPSGNYKLFAIIAEKEVNLAAGNGEKIHNDVFRKFLSPVDGMDITLAPQGGSLNQNYSYTVANTWVESQVYVTVWIQNAATKEVINSGTKFDIISANQDVNIGQFKIYPNPVRDQMNIQFDQTTNTNYQATVTNLFGTVFKTALVRAGTNQFNIPVSEIPRGTYFIRLSSGNKNYTKKWIKS